MLVRALVLLTHDTIISRSVSVEASTQKRNQSKKCRTKRSDTFFSDCFTVPKSQKKTAKNETDLFFFQKTGNRETLVLKTGKPDLSYPLELCNNAGKLCQCRSEHHHAS